jgi:hypothetical protein
MGLNKWRLDRDLHKDRDGPIGFESKAERARLFAAKMCLLAALPVGRRRKGHRGRPMPT